jgi:acetyl esterase
MKLKKILKLSALFFIIVMLSAIGFIWYNTYTPYGKLSWQSVLILKFMGDSPEPGTVSIQETRQGLKDITTKYGGATIPIEIVRDLAVSNDVKIRLYKNHQKENVPVMIFFHGGAWRAGDLDTHDSLCRRMAKAGEVIVVSVDFRRSPEHEYPTAIEDAFFALNWVHQHIKEFGGDPQKIAVGGDSSGGNISAALTLYTRDFKGPVIGFQFLFYPALNLYETNSKSYQNFANGYFLRKRDMDEAIGQYIPDVERRKEPYASPLFETNFKNIPPGVVVTAEFDPLRDEGEAYGNLLKKNGIQMDVIRYPGTIHGFVSAELFPESDIVINDLIKRILINFNKG